MNDVFGPNSKKFVLFFFHDILIYRKSWHKHKEHVRRVLDVSEKHQFFAKISKCEIGVQELEHFSHVITDSNIVTNLKKSKNNA